MKIFRFISTCACAAALLALAGCAMPLALREWLKPKFVIPMHYGANPLGKGTPAEFIQALGATTTRVLPLRPGEKAEF